MYLQVYNHDNIKDGGYNSAVDVAVVAVVTYRFFLSGGSLPRRTLPVRRPPAGDKSLTNSLTKSLVSKIVVVVVMVVLKIVVKIVVRTVVKIVLKIVKNST